MKNKFKQEMLTHDKLEKGYAMLDITNKGNTTKSITFKQEDILVSYLEGLTLDEIAIEMNINKSGVREHLLRVNRKIKFLIGEGEGLIMIYTPPTPIKNMYCLNINWDKLNTEEQETLDILLNKAKD